jgi:hypothetical protein
MIPGMYYVQLLFPYLDRHVMQAYHSLPIQYLDGQRAHCYVGFHRFRAFGDYQACGYPISLRREAAWPFPIQAGRWLAGRWSAWRSGRHRQPWTPMQIRAYEEAVTSPLFKADYLHRLFEDRRITPGMLYKIQTLAKFYARYISSEPVDLQAA